MHFWKKIFILTFFILKVLVVVYFIDFHLYAQTIASNREIVIKDTSSSRTENHFELSKCEVIHVGIVCTGYEFNVHFHTMLKSLYFYRNNPIHFHVIVDDVSKKILKTLFQTWAMPKVSADFYNVKNLPSNLQWLSKKLDLVLLKLLFPTIIPLTVTDKIIVIEPLLTFASDIRELWNVFNNFEHEHVIGLTENLLYPELNAGKRYNSDVILFHLQHLTTTNWNLLKIFENELKYSPDDDIINEVVGENLDLIYELPCYWNSRTGNTTNNYNCYNNNDIKLLHFNTLREDNNYYNRFTAYNGNLMRTQLFDCVGSSVPITKSVIKQCSEFPEAKIYERRMLLFFREFKYTPTENDVTFVTQLSYDKLEILEDLSQRWDGPMSLSFYITDSELHHCIHFIENSPTLKKRFNIAYHAVFKEGNYHPINALRNVALRNVVTPYVFLDDIDLIPMKGMYLNIKKYIGETGDMHKKALVVAAFETSQSKTRIPNTKGELLKMLDKKVVSIVKYRVRPEGHGPTNYGTWKTAKAPYKVEWKPKYEPYVIVQNNVTEYDERFFAYGRDKISHIMELQAQGYEFVVLPEAFIVHKAHAPTSDKGKFLKSSTYKTCLKTLERNFIEELEEKYGHQPKI